MHGPVSLHGVCSTNLSRKPAGHRNVSQLPSIKALPHGLSREDCEVHLADANVLRDFRIYQDFGYVLIDIASKLYRDEEFGLDLKLAVYALDSTVIDLCLSTFPCVTFRKTKAAVKNHTPLNVQGSIPTFIFVTPGSVHDVNMTDTVPFEADRSIPWTAHISTSSGCITSIS